MPSADPAMDVYLRLVAERGNAEEARSEAAAHFADNAAHMDPEIIWRIVAENLKRRAASEHGDEQLRLNKAADGARGAKLSGNRS